MRNAYFLDDKSPNQNKHKALAAGNFVISAWDHEFTDNAGSYRLHVVVKRGNVRLPEAHQPDRVE